MSPKNTESPLRLPATAFTGELLGFLSALDYRV